MNLLTFVIESNKIEGIHRPPTKTELIVTRDFITGSQPTVESLSGLAVAYAGKRAQLREREGMDVRVGSYYPPRGGPHIHARLQGLLTRMESIGAYKCHLQYESLHPFIDGNGRTGRALWAWQMQRESPEMLDLNFLHAFYYQTLSALGNKSQ